MRVAVLGLVALLILTAGCSTFGGERATPTVTPAEVPPEPTAALDSGTAVAPGISPDNVTDVDYLAERHAAATGNATYVWNETRREYRPEEDGGGIAAESRTHVVTNGTAFYRRSRYVGSSPSRAGNYTYKLVEYRRGNATYSKWRSSRHGEPRYSRVEEPPFAPRHNLSAAEAIRTHLDLTAANVTRIDVGRRDHVLVTGTLQYHDAYGPVEAYHARAVVREDGFVRRLTANFTVTIDGRRIPVVYRFAYSEVGTAEVTPPAWLAAAREQAGNRTEQVE